ncbi:hypothetical protein VTK26DRAFT_7897 [Humicola hyalothermophila]
MRLSCALRPALLRRGFLARPALVPLAVRVKNYSSEATPETGAEPAAPVTEVKSDGAPPAKRATATKAAKAAKAGKPAIQYPPLELGEYTVRRTRLGLDVRRAKKQHYRPLPWFWLRDNCRCAQCVNQATLQRNFNTFDIPANIMPASISGDAEGVSVTWSDGHQSRYPFNFLRRYAEGEPRPGAGDVEHVYWGSEIAQNPPTVAYDAVMQSDAGVAEMTRHIMTLGFIFVKGTPYDDPDKTRQLLERIGPIRVTHYGGFYDFIPDMSMADTAYTNIALAAHTDTTYFTEPARLQAFHLLSHQPAPGASPDETASGGQSLLVDGFNAAQILKTENPEAYSILQKHRLPWHASGNEGITIAPSTRYPVLESSRGVGAIHRVRWNNDDRGVVPWTKEHSPYKWYKAARAWDEILRRKTSEYWFQLEPGTTLIFDNWRVLHGRAAFTGIRRICGAYICGDDFVSRFRNTNFGREGALDRVIG